MTSISVDFVVEEENLWVTRAHARLALTPNYVSEWLQELHVYHEGGAAFLQLHAERFVRVDSDASEHWEAVIYSVQAVLPGPAGGDIIRSPEDLNETLASSLMI